MRKPPAEGARIVTTLRLLPTIKEAVEAKAAANGRSLAQEVEARLSWSLDKERRTPAKHAAMFLEAMGSFFHSFEERTGQQIGTHSIPTIAAREVLQIMIPTMFPYFSPVLDKQYEAGIAAARLAAKREIAEQDDVGLVESAEIISRHIREALEGAGVLDSEKRA